MIPTTDPRPEAWSVVGIMASTRPIGSTGDSDAWMDSKADYVRIFGVFQSSGFWKEEVWGDAVTIDSGDDVHAFLMCLSSIAEGPKIIVELPEDVVTDKMVYETFVDFLTKPAEDQGYVIGPGNWSKPPSRGRG